MPLYNFTDNGKSVTIQIDIQSITIAKNVVDLVLVNDIDNKILEIRTNEYKYKDYEINLDTDTVTGVGAGSTTATELRDALLAIFFLDESGGGSDVSAHHGFFDYNDTSTSTSSISLLADVWANVPNDGLGTFTNIDYIPTGMTKLMDTSNGSLDFTELTLGSDVLIRIDFNVTPQTNNALLESRYVLGTGAGLYSLPIVSRRLDSGAGIPYSSEKGSFYIYMGDTNTLDNPGILQVKLSTGGTLVNNGLAIKVYKK
tara:strand:+ start:281 stop:1051 length:771 start_codon:yes stop_codon:yes gene_type:complete